MEQKRSSDMATVLCGLKSLTQSVVSHFVQDINAARQKISSPLVIGHARIGDKWLRKRFVYLNFRLLSRDHYSNKQQEDLQMKLLVQRPVLAGISFVVLHLC